MVNRLVSVGDDFNLPAAVNVVDENLPARLGAGELSATIVDKNVLLSRGEASFNAAAAPNGTVAAMDSGQAVINFGISPLVVSGGKITHPVTTTNNGGYIEAQLSGPVVESILDFEFPVDTTGLVVIAWPEAEWGNGTSVDFTLVAGLHLWVSRTGWRAESYDGPTQGASNVIYASGTFATPLALNKTHRVTAMLDRASSTLRLHLPDGTVSTMTNALLTTKTSDYVAFQLYEQLSTAPAAAIIRMSASSERTTATPSMSRVLDISTGAAKALVALPQAKIYNPATVETTATTSAGTLIPGASIPTYVAPASGVIRVDWSGHIVMSAPSKVYWAILSSGPAVSVEVVPPDSAGADQKYTGPMNASFIITGLTPGATVNIRCRQLSTVASAASYRTGTAGSDAYPTYITVTQVQSV